MLVKERKPTSQEAALLAEYYVTAHKVESRPNVPNKRENVVCHKCKKTGHYAQECTETDVTTEPQKEQPPDLQPKPRRDTTK